MPSGRSALRTLALAALLLAPAAPLGAQEPAFAPGRTTERVAARSDTTQKYAVYVPSAYSEARTWPVLVVMDPRGRALFALDLFREAAERHGWIVFSSYRTLSDADTASDVNHRALEAILRDAERLRVDPRRLYLAGFSGTARQGWTMAYGLQGNVAGFIGVGGGFPGPDGIWRTLLNGVQPPFAFFGASGGVDFNENEMFSADTVLDHTSLPHRVVRFEGGHTWFPKEVAAEAVTWMQLQAVKARLAPRDSALADSVFGARMAAARALEAAGETGDAYLQYRSAATDFAGLLDVTAAGEAAGRLERDGRVRRALERRRALEKEVVRYKIAAEEYAESLRDLPRMPADARTFARLRLAELKRQAADSTDREAARAAGAMLEFTYVVYAFYEPRRYLDRGDPARALASLRVAREIKPENPFVCWSFALAHAQAGDRDAAFRELECAERGAILTVAALEREPFLEPLRADARFGALLERVRAAPPPAR
ncbi:MAG TPA: hypothetical protein VHG91_09460 [Longimicrobium sp.]|nr:hypothetical protein [Longimicrobium sp.]